MEGENEVKMEKGKCREWKEKTRWKWKRLNVENGRRERGGNGKG